MGQGMQFASSAYHSLIHAPKGSKGSDFIHGFMRNAETSGIQMAKWSIASTAIEPFFENKFEKKWLEGMVVGATTGALLEVRSGLGGMAQGAISGATQSLGMSAINAALYYVVAPVRNHFNRKSLAKFNERKGKEVYATPIDVLTKAFF